MGAEKPLMTVISTKGQVILPKSLRDRRKWNAGTRLLVEETPDGILLRTAPLFTPTKPEDVAGMLRRPGQRPVTLEEMDAAITEETRIRARD